MMRHFARNVKIPIVYHDVEYFFKDKKKFAEYTTNETIKNIKDRYLNWCSQHPNLDSASLALADQRILDDTRISTPPPNQQWSCRH
ncbi:hypothetical protein GEMRC1_009529 [Eukaryota sp. GEM-RC1]